MLNILIVEDNYAEMEYCATLIEQLNKKVNLFKAGTGEKAMDAVLNNDIDLAFIDIKLPDFSGFQLASRIREMKKYRFAWIIFMTAENADPLDAYRRFHCYDYLRKPLIPEEFHDIVKPLLEEIEEKR